MKKTIKEVVEAIEIKHEFYCDKCNEYLGTSYECDDGWYNELGNFELKLNVDGWLRVRKCLCTKCRYEFINKLRTNLFDIGFEAY